MKVLSVYAAIVICATTASFCVHAQQAPVLVQGSLIAPGSEPFHLKATITEGRDSSPIADVEMYWVAPDKWRRTIHSHDFSQTLIVNGDKVFDQHSNDYFPLGLTTLTTAMVDLQPILAAYQPGDPQLTKANGASSESGLTCYDSLTHVIAANQAGSLQLTRANGTTCAPNTICTETAHKMCLQGRYGMMESVQVAGHSIDLMSYQGFHGKRIARRIIYMISVGDFETLEIAELEPLKHQDESLFEIQQPTLPSEQLATAFLKETELRSLAIEHPDIIWPQVLDGAQTGSASFYVGIDPHGKVREVLPIRTANERSNDSAIRTINKWKFKPAMLNGHPAQSEGLLTFALDTRAYGPKDTLSDAELRKLAANMIEPVVPPGSVPPGTEYKLWIAVDADGIVIEKIKAEGPPDLFGPIDHALLQWHFSPIIENGQPRPYRGLLVFKF